MTFAIKMHYGHEFWTPATWPPLYPFLVNCLMFLTDFPVEAAALVSGITLLATLLTFARVLHHCEVDQVTTASFVLLLAILSGILYIHRSAWSEQPFTALVLLHIHFILRHRSSQRLRDYFLAAIFASLVPLTRYLGYAVLFSFVCYFLYNLVITRTAVRKTIASLLPGLLIAVAPIALYVLRNRFALGTFHGKRTPTSLTVLDNTSRLVRVIAADWGILLVVLLVIALALLLLSWVRPRRRIRSPSEFARHYALLVAVVYAGLVVYSTSRAAMDPLETRFLAPIYPPLLVFLAVTFAMSMSRLDATKGRPLARNVARAASGALAIVVICPQASSALGLLKRIQKAEASPCYHGAAGFNLSSTAGNLNEYLRRRLLADGTIHVTSIADFTPFAKKPHETRSLFYRGVLTDNAETTKITYEHLGTTTQLNHRRDLQWADFTLSCNLRGSQRLLVYHTLPPLRDDEQFAREMRRTLENDKVPSLCVFMLTVGRNQIVAGNNMTGLLNRGLQIRVHAYIPPYLIYDCALAHP